MTLFLQVAVWGALLAYLWRCRAYMYRRSRANWADLIAQLASPSMLEGDMECGIAGLSPLNHATPMNTPGRRAAWQRFKDARIAMEMADYAERNSVASMDRTTLASIRKDAMQTRISSLEVLAKSLFTA